MTAEATPTAAGAQPDGGAAAPPADGQGPGLGLYDLSAAPEELRPYLEQELKKYDGQVTKKLMDASDFRKKYEPFEQIDGLTDVPADELGELMQFRQIATAAEQGDEQAVATFEDWWSQIGETYGFFGDGEGGESGGEGEPTGDEPPPWAQKLTDRLDALEEGVKPISEHVTKDEQRQRETAAAEQIQTELDALKEQHGEFDENAVCQLAMAYPDAEDAVAKGFADYQRITGQAKGELVDGKLDQPAAALANGQPSSEPEQFGRLDDPKLKAAAKARFAGAR